MTALLNIQASLFKFILFQYDKETSQIILKCLMGHDLKQLLTLIIFGTGGNINNQDLVTAFIFMSGAHCQIRIDFFFFLTKVTLMQFVEFIMILLYFLLNVLAY